MNKALITCQEYFSYISDREGGAEMCGGFKNIGVNLHPSRV